MRPMWMLSALLFLFLSACGSQTPTGDRDPDSGVDTDSDSDPDSDTAPTDRAPAFHGFVLAYSDTTESIRLHWAPGHDDRTDAADLRYALYQGASAAQVAGASTRGEDPIATFTGGDTTSHVVDGLAPGETRAFVMVAIDEAGTPSDEPPPQEITTLDADPVFSQIPKDLGALDLTVVDTDRDRFTLRGPDAGQIAVGDVVVAPNPYGRWLRRVLTVTPRGDEVLLTTEPTDMASFFQQGVLRTRVTAVEPADGSERSGIAPDGFRTLATTDPQGVFTITERSRQDPFDEDVAHASSGEAELAAGISYAWEASFMPTVEVEAEFDEDVIGAPRRLRAQATGVFVFEGSAGYFYEASASYKAKKVLFERTISLRYVVGAPPAAVPVWQDVTLSFTAEVDLSTEAEFKVDSVLRAEKTITLTVEYDETSGWSFDTQEGFDQTFDLTVDGHANAGATLRVVGGLGTSFYKSAEATLSVAPTLGMEADARLVPTPVEMTRFDVDFWVDAWVDADFTILGKELASWKSDKVQLVHIPLFSLPELKITPQDGTATVCRDKRLFLGITDGYNNAVPPENISWEVVEDVRGVTLEVDGPANIVATTGHDEETTYTVRASAYGDGVLGPLGTRYATATVTVEDPDPCDPDEPDFSAGDIIGCQSGQRGLLGPPTLDKNRITPGERITVSAPYTCPDPAGCWVQVSARRKDAPSTQNACFTVVAELCDLTDVGPPNRDHPQLIGVLDSEIHPGTYYPAFLFQDGYQAIQHDGALYNLGFDGLGSSYDVQQYSQDEDCEDSSGIPVPTFTIVGPTDGDLNDEPGDAPPLDINGPRVRSTFRRSNDNHGDDTDWYRITPTEDDVYDAALGYDPTCEFTFCALADDGRPLPVWLYPSEQDAEDGTHVIASATHGCVAAQGVPDQTFYTQTTRVGASRTPIPYDIRVTSDCDSPYYASFQRLTASPILSGSTVRRGETVDVTLAFTDNVTAVQVGLLHPTDPRLSGSTFEKVEGLDGQTTTTVTLQTRGSAHPETYWLQVRLHRPETGRIGTTYARDLAVSPDTYSATANRFDADGFGAGTVTFDSNLELSEIRVTE